VDAKGSDKYHDSTITMQHHHTNITEQQSKAEQSAKEQSRAEHKRAEHKRAEQSTKEHKRAEHRTAADDDTTSSL
jgi:hypothetical protein